MSLAACGADLRAGCATLESEDALRDELKMAALLLIVGELLLFWLWAKSKVSEAPIDWLLHTAATPFHVLSVIWVLRSAFYGFEVLFAIRHVYFGKAFHLIFNLTQGCAHIATLKILGNDHVAPCTKHLCVMLVFFCSALVIICSQSINADPMYRHRTLGMIAMMWRVSVPFIGLRMRHSFVGISLATFVECLATWASLYMFEGSNAPYVRITCTLLVYSAVSLAWCYLCCTMWGTFYQNERRLLVEKETLESILTMTCDATFWMGADGDTLLDRNNPLEAILGSDLKGTRLSDHMSPSESARLHTLTTKPVDGSPVQVHLLPTSFLPKTMPAVNADLLIVDRTDTFTVKTHVEQESIEPQAGSSQRRGFFVGFRLAKPCDMDIKPLDARQGNGSDAASNPRTQRRIPRKDALPSIPERD